MTPTALPARIATPLGARPASRNARETPYRSAACASAYIITAADVTSNVRVANVRRSTEGSVALNKIFNSAFPASTSARPIRRRKYPKPIVDSARRRRAFASPSAIVRTVARMETRRGL